MDLSYKNLYLKINQSEQSNRVTNAEGSIRYAGNFSHLLFGGRYISTDKPLLTDWQKNLIYFGSICTSNLLFLLTLPASVPPFVFIAAPLIGIVLGNIVIDLIYKAKDLPRTTLTLKLLSEFTLLPILYRGIKETAKELLPTYAPRL